MLQQVPTSTWSARAWKQSSHGKYTGSPPSEWPGHQSLHRHRHWDHQGAVLSSHSSIQIHAYWMLSVHQAPCPLQQSAKLTIFDLMVKDKKLITKQRNTLTTLDANKEKAQGARKHIIGIWPMGVEWRKATLRELERDGRKVGRQVLKEPRTKVLRQQRAAH